MRKIGLLLTRSSFAQGSTRVGSRGLDEEGAPLPRCGRPIPGSYYTGWAKEIDSGIARAADGPLDYLGHAVQQARGAMGLNKNRVNEQRIDQLLAAIGRLWLRALGERRQSPGATTFAVIVGGGYELRLLQLHALAGGVEHVAEDPA